MSSKIINKKRRNLIQRCLITKNTLKNSVSLYCRLRKSLPRQKAHLSFNGVHSRSINVRYNPISKKHDNSNG